MTPKLVTAKSCVAAKRLPLECWNAELDVFDIPREIVGLERRHFPSEVGLALARKSHPDKWRTIEDHTSDHTAENVSFRSFHAGQIL